MIRADNIYLERYFRSNTPITTTRSVELGKGLKDSEEEQHYEPS